MEKLKFVIIGDLKNTQFEVTIWANHNNLAMVQMKNCNFGLTLSGLKDTNVKIRKKTTDNVTKSNKCNQCNATTYLLKQTIWRFI